MSIEVVYIHQLPLPSTGNEKGQTYWLEIQQQNRCTQYFQSVTRIKLARGKVRMGLSHEGP